MYPHDLARADAVMVIFLKAKNLNFMCVRSRQRRPSNMCPAICTNCNTNKKKIPTVFCFSVCLFVCFHFLPLDPSKADTFPILLHLPVLNFIQLKSELFPPSLPPSHLMIGSQHIHKMVLRLPGSWSNWNLEMLVFEERGKPENPEKNLSEQRRQPTTNSTHAHMASTPGFEPRPHWWEACAVTTAPALAPHLV